MRIDRLTNDLKHLRSKGARYWLVVLSLVPLGMLIGEAMGEWNLWVTARHEIYRLLQDMSPHFSKYSKRTVLVLIEDEEYWRGGLARRTPLKRDYIARLLRKLDMADPAAIGLDVDLRSQTPDKSMVTHPDYGNETGELISAINDVSGRRCLVLARTLERRSDGVVPEPAVFDSIEKSEGAEFKEGYASLPRDIRRVPIAVGLANGKREDSFSAALARCVDPASVAEAQVNQEDALPFGTFIKPDGFQSLSSGYVLETEMNELRERISHQVVIVGGAWHEGMLGRGKLIDSRLTPVGHLGGSFIHGNYVEAILYNRTYAPMRKEVGVAIELLMSFLVALVFALDRPIVSKLLLAGALGVFLVVFSLFSWQNLGLFFDFFIPAVLLVGHMVVEHVLEWREDAIKFRCLERSKCA